jgi:hypothetical protein
MAKTTTITVQGVLSGKTITLTEDPKVPISGRPLPEDLPVTVHIEIGLPPGMLAAYGAWKDMPGIETLDAELEELRGRRSCSTEER